MLQSEDKVCCFCVSPQDEEERDTTMTRAHKVDDLKVQIWQDRRQCGEIRTLRRIYLVTGARKLEGRITLLTIPIEGLVRGSVLKDGNNRSNNCGIVGGEELEEEGPHLTSAITSVPSITMPSTPFLRRPRSWLTILRKSSPGYNQNESQ